MARLMKDSGISWIGEIPADWEIVKFGRLFSIAAGGDAKPEFYSVVQDEEHSYPVYTNSMIKEQVYAYTSKPVFKKNTITVTGRGAIGHAFYRDVPYDAIIRLLSLCPKIELDGRFYAYWINNVVHFFSDSAAVGQLSSVQMATYKTAFCTIFEQQRIANFLDAECARIDAIIEQTRATVEEYKKLKQSIITQAVTKGIRPNRPMKDSGIEWIGEIPEDWEIHKLCWDYSAELGKMLDAKRVTGEHLHPYIKNADVQWWRINALGLDEMDFSDDEDDRYTVKRGDLIICEGGEIGKCAVVPDDFPEGIYYQKALHRVRPRNRKLSNAYYLSYVIFCMAKQDAFETTHEKATIQHLPGDALSQLRIPTPPYNEQSQIVSYISDEMARIDGLIQKKDQLLTEIDSYRKSLIYEYVTGKKEVL